jgi:hypothetical protein
VSDPLGTLQSTSTTLEDLRQRVSATADGLLADGDESGATELFEVERALRQAARRLHRYLASRG